MRDLADRLSVGVDIEQVARFADMIEKFERSSLARIYTRHELEYCFSKQRPAPSLAARFAFKEAAFKALSPLGLHIYYRQIEIVNAPGGAPRAHFLDEILNRKFLLKVSLSHGRSEAVAIVIALMLD